MATATYSSLVGLAVGGKYQVRRVLGVGGMGVVCEAIHLDLGKRVALKLIDKSMKESELIVARFRREAWAASQIESEHIVDVFDVGADARVGLYMVMEHLSGEDLETRIGRERIEVRMVVMIAHQIARGLAKAHAAGVVHRDLKPANIFLTQRDNGQLQVKILDFGVSKLLGDTGGAKITGSGAPVGTPLYMSPEQAEGQEDCDGRADIWSLGAVLYEAFAGSSAFPDRGSYHGTLVGILTTKPAPLGSVAPWVPTGIANLVDDMLVHDRDVRVPDAQTVTRRLIEAFPGVLPDGTGRHTAVIVSSTADETGDTEVFNSASMPAALRKPPSSGPAPARHTAPNTDPGVDVHFTDPGIAAAPAPAPGSSPTSQPVASDPRSSGGYLATGPNARTSGAHAVSGHPVSSAAGMAMPLTPPPEVGPPSAVPDTVRDLRLAKRAALRRVITTVALGVTVIGIAAGSYFAGQRTSTSRPAPPPSATLLDGVAPPASALPAATTAEPTPAPEATATATTTDAGPGSHVDTPSSAEAP